MATDDLYASLIQPIENRMIRSVWRILRDPGEVEDTFQDVLATIWKRLDRIREHPNPHALVLRICADTARDALRRKIRRGRREESLAVLTQQAAKEDSAAQAIGERERAAQVLGAISQLPRRQAQTVLMRFVQELPYGDIALAMGCSESTVRNPVSYTHLTLPTN